MPDTPATPAASPIPLRLAQRALAVKPRGHAPHAGGIISFGSGDAYLEAFPDLTPMAILAAQKFRTETLQYSPGYGLGELREWIVEHLAREGVRTTPDSILVVYGAKQGLELVCKLLLDPGDAVVVTRPTYPGALGIFRSWEAELVEVGLDDDGIDVDEIETTLRERARSGRRTPKLVYDIPEFHNPAGVTMSRDRRERLVDLAMRYGMLIVEDDPYRRVRFDGSPVAPIQAVDPFGCVIGLGTFSKLLAPGLRLGWVAASREIVSRLSPLKADGGSCPFTQRIIVEYCRAGLIEPSLRDRTRMYAGHRDVMVRALREQLPEATFRVPSGGYYLWVALPDSIDTDRLHHAAEQLGVEFTPGIRFYATPGPRNFLRLAYSYASPSDIIEGVRRIRQAMSALR